MFLILSNPLNPKGVVVSCYSKNLNRDIFFRPASSDMFVLGQVFIGEEYNYNFRFTPDFMIDGGAHCGFATLYFLSRFPGMKIIAIEPEEGNFSILKKNLGNLDNVTLINSALLDESKNVELINPGAKSPSFQYKSSIESTDKRSVTILQILNEHAADFDYGILKLDIEGAEKGIFSNNPETWIDEFELIFVEPHDWIYPGTEKTIRDVAKSNNKEIDKIGENIVLKKE
jgi:FkbM family methyltransferase